MISWGLKDGAVRIWPRRLGPAFPGPKVLICCKENSYHIKIILSATEKRPLIKGSTRNERKIILINLIGSYINTVIMSTKSGIEKSTGFIIYRTALAMRAALQRTLKERGFDITPEQYGILMLLREAQGLSQKEIGDVLFKDKPNISRMLDALERKNIILRQSTDRRRYAIFLTAEGQRLAEEILPLKLQLQEKAMNGLLTREKETLENLLDKIYRNIS